MTVLVRRFFSRNGIIGTEHGRSDLNQSCETQDSFVHKGAEVGLDLSTKAVPKEKLTLLRRGLGLHWHSDGNGWVLGRPL